MAAQLLGKLDEHEVKIAQLLEQQRSVVERALQSSFDQLRHGLNQAEVVQTAKEAPGEITSLNQVGGTWQPLAAGDAEPPPAMTPTLSERKLSESMEVVSAGFPADDVQWTRATSPESRRASGLGSAPGSPRTALSESANVSNVFRNITDLGAPQASEDEKKKCGRAGALLLLDYFAAGVVLLNSITLILELELEGQAARADMIAGNGPLQTNLLRPYWRAADGLFDTLFLLEILSRMALEKRNFHKNFANLFDMLLAFFALLDLIVVTAQEADRANLGTMQRNLLRAISSLRAFRLLRVLRLCRGLHLLLKACQSFISSLFWSMVLLVLFMLVGALVIGNVLQDFIQDPTADLQDRQWVWHHYGTAYRAWLTLYELTFSGSWPSSTRPVLDKVSQGFVVFFVLYITVIAFALIRIITAVFLKDTLDAANNDAELQTIENMQREEKFVRHLEGIFRAIDDTGDGMITQERLERVLSNPKVRAYFQTLGLDLVESTALFRILDDGDGEVTQQEFISGIIRCKGHARAIDQVSLQTDIRALDKKISSLAEAFQVDEGSGSKKIGHLSHLSQLNAASRHKRESQAELLRLFNRAKSVDLH